jgi:2-keto-4-pentenoate hydratase/2-oxohepta-3-ene-1,7-dioic acid hydratase in catechol pathway
MTRSFVTLAIALVLAAGSLAGQGSRPAQPFKLGMFQASGKPFLGMVLNDSFVVDLSRTFLGLPPTLQELIAVWDNQISSKLITLAQSSAKQAPSFALRLDQVKTLPPIGNPGVLLNVAVNYQEHAVEMRSETTIAQGSEPLDPKIAAGLPGMWERAPGDRRQNPYFFIKANRSMIGHGDTILLPKGRPQIDWECELNVVIGKTARRVKAAEAAEYIFGYTLDNDVSDRGGRADGRHGTDWIIGKSHDTFFPTGPWIVPRQFVADPQHLPIMFSLSGKIMQDSNTDRMTHTVFELVEFASHIMTLQPGDMISTGSPAGVGTARGTPVYFRDGDISTCTIQGIGTLENPVKLDRSQ